jgi:type IV pilus assembly protein PilM
MAIWAAYQNIAASKAREQAENMIETRDQLAPLKQDIDSLLKKEAALRQIANGYTNAEADHAFWMDTLAELRGAFASDAVWLTDLVPIHGFDPAKALDPALDPKRTQNGQPVVKPEFFAAQYGSSALTNIKVEQPEPQRGRRPAAPSPTSEPTANAIRINGFWRENPKSQNVVSELLKRLRDKSVAFKFSIPDPKDPKRSIVIVDDQNIGKFMSITSVSAQSGDLAQPFEITLPLAREVAIK